tara:strand:- start:1191 stop:1352 length:162 start_codon:yes stop_codon:yes gene_type:complete
MGSLLSFFSRQIIIPKFVELPTINEDKDNMLQYETPSENIIDIKPNTLNIITS